MCQQSLQRLCFSYATEMPWFPLPVDTSTAEQGVSAGTGTANHFHQGTYTVSVGSFWGIRAVRPSSETPVNAHWNLPLCRTPGEHRAGVKHFFTCCAGQQNCSEEGSSSTCFFTLNSPWFFFFLSVPSIPFLVLGTAPLVEALKSAYKARSTVRLRERKDWGLRSAAPSPPRGGRFKVSLLLATTHL